MRKVCLQRLCALSLFAVGSVFAELPPGRLLHMTRPSPVFAKPSAKAKALADVDPGTVLFLRKLSAQKTWAYVEDEDGHKGWVPVNRTDYVFLPPDLEKAEKKKPAKKGVEDDDGPFHREEERRREEAQRSVVDDGWRHHVDFVHGRAAFKDPHATIFSVGLSYFLGLPMQTGGALVTREGHLGPELGFWLALKEGNAFAFSLPLRLRLLGRSAGSRFLSGPDLGALFMFQKYRGGGTDTYWSLSLGYSFGLCGRDGKGFSAHLRPGVEFFHSTRLSVELGAGWIF